MPGDMNHSQAHESIRHTRMPATLTCVLIHKYAIYTQHAGKLIIFIHA